MESVQDITDEINAALDIQATSNPALTGLSTSTVSEWVGLKAMFTAAVFTLVSFWKAFMAEIEAKIAGGKYGTQAWWKQTMLAYQDGDALPEGETTYAVIDASKQIITRCAITKNTNGKIIIKVAKSTGALAGTITSGEFSRVNDYITDIKGFCTDHQLVSLPADEVKSIIDIRYDGKLIQADVLAAVEAAINGYLANVRFDGAFNINRFRDAIEAVPGVHPGGVDIANVQIKPNGGAYTTVLREYMPASGYYNYLPDVSTHNMIAS